MSVSRFKHYLLAFLILISIFLSYIIWVPRTTEPSDTDIQPDSQTPGALVDRGMHDVYSPRNYILHTNNMVAYDPSIFDGIYNDLIETLYLEELDAGYEVSMDTYSANLANQSNVIEFVYPDLLPFGILSDNFNNIPTDLADTQFDRFYINLNDPDVVYFYNTRNEVMTEVDVSQIELESINENLVEDNQLFNVYQQSFQSKYSYLPTNTFTVNSSHYLVERLPNNLYSSFFFPDPSGVELRVSNNISRYIDLTTELRINNSTNVLTYFRQLSDLNELSRTERFTQSVNELNALENWTHQIKFVDTNEQLKHVRYRRFLDDLPIFSDGELASISEVGVLEDGLTHLKLPLLIVQTPITLDEDAEVSLPSGNTVMNILSNVIDTSDIQDLAVGVQWQDTDESAQVIRFEPKWFIKVADVWTDVESYVEGEGGSTDGL